MRWIGAEDSDEPAPTVTLAAAEDEHGATGAEEEADAEPAAATTSGPRGPSGTVIPMTR